MPQPASMLDRGGSSGFKTDSLLANTEPINDSDSISTVSYLRRGKKTAMQQQLGERSENMGEQQFCRHQGQKRKRGSKCSRCWTGDSPTAHNQNMLKQAVPCSPWRLMVEQPMGRPHTKEGGCSWRKLWPHGKPILEQAPDRTSGPMGR